MNKHTRKSNARLVYQPNQIDAMNAMKYTPYSKKRDCRFRRPNVNLVFKRTH